MLVYFGILSAILERIEDGAEEGSRDDMNKESVIDAYRRGYLTIRECGQILGLEEAQLLAYLQSEPGDELRFTERLKQAGGR